jgi:hypothetical protein
MSRSVKNEIDRRTSDASKLAALEARKVAILEMVAGLMQEAVDLMRNEGFTAPAVVPQPYVGATVIKEASLVQAPAPQIKNPCASCGQEAMGTEDLPGGQKKYLCAVHYRARLAEKQQEQTTKDLMGSEGTLYQRAKQPTQSPHKVIIQADPLLGVQNGGTAVRPPPNPILDETGE